MILTEYPVTSRSSWGWDQSPNGPVSAVLDRYDADVDALAKELCGLASWCRTIPYEPTDSTTPYWSNRFWGTIDAVMLVHQLRERNPTTYLEVGSGNSTMFARRAIEDFGLDTTIVSIDPVPRADIDDLCDEVIRAPFGEVAAQQMARLQPGDVFVLDGSHLGFTGSEAVLFFADLIAGVPEGVMVAVDDIFLPDDYHPTWADRWYGEQYLLAAWLLGGHAGWDIVLPTWNATDPAKPDRFGELWPIVESWAGRRGVGFWMERRSPST